MVKANRQSSQQPDAANPPDDTAQATTTSQPTTSDTDSKKGKLSKKNRRPAIGGSAIVGAKSTQIRELSNGTPANQQPDYYNRETRRRMQQMGTGPYTDRTASDPRERRRKRAKERQEQVRRTVETKGPSRDIKLGRRNALFIVGTIVVLIVLVALFLIIRHPF